MHIANKLIAGCVLAVVPYTFVPAAYAQSTSVPDLTSLSARPGYQLQSMHLQTDRLYISAGKYYEFRDNIPYKKPVRIVSNLFEYPEGFDAARDRDARNQFAAHVLANYPEWIEKLCGHGRAGNVGNVSFYKGSEKIAESSYRGLFDVGSDPKWQYDILYVDDFKYVERKTKTAAAKAAREVDAIIGDPAAAKR